VEIYNRSPFEIDLGGFPFYLSTATTTGARATLWQHQLLTGTLNTGDIITIAINNTSFSGAYGFTADIENTSFAIDGVSGIILTKEFDAETGGGTTLDLYGSTSADGTGAPWEYSNRKVTRKYGEGPNTAFDIDEWSIRNVTFSQVVDMTPGSHEADVTFNGAARTNEYRNKGNWDAGYVPDAGHNAIIDAACEIGNGLEATVNDLEITSTRAGSLNITATPSALGSLITYGTVTGTATVQKYLPADEWTYVSMPVTSAIANVFLNIYLQTYDTENGAWFDWIIDPNTPLAVGQGYAAWPSSTSPPVGNTTRTYTGTLNTGAQSLALVTPPPPRAFDGWNFKGNPYPSGLDWESDAWDKTDLDQDQFSIWDGTSYITYSSGGGSVPPGASQYIATQEGFFVLSSTGGDLTVNDNARAHIDRLPYKQSQEFSNRLRLILETGTYSDEAVIYFNENAGPGNDFSYDANKFFASEKSQLYTLDQGAKRVINSFKNVGETPVVDMGLKVYEGGDFSINALALETFDAEVPIYLEDMEMGLFINLREQNSYEFSSTPGDEEVRFRVHFTDITGITDPVNEDVNAVYAYNKDVYVDFSGIRGEIVVYNVVGQEVYRAVAERGLNKFTLTSGSGNYIVKVIGDNTMVSEKVFIK
jgi:hypothetical protein